MAAEAQGYTGHPIQPQSGLQAQMPIGYSQSRQAMPSQQPVQAHVPFGSQQATAANPKEAEALGYTGHPAPYPIQPQSGLQAQMPIGYSHSPQAMPSQQPVQAHVPFGYQQAPLPSYQGQAQHSFAPMQQPIQGAPIQVASQSSMVYSGPSTQQYMMQAAPMPMASALIKQPVSVAFGSPMVAPGVQMMPMQVTMQQMAPLQPEAPPPYPGPSDDEKYALPGAPKNIYV